MTRENELLRKILRGENEYWEELIGMYYEDIYRYCIYHAPDRNLAQDAVQETFLKVIRYFPNYRDRGKFRAFLYKVASNVCTDQWRKCREEEIPEDTVYLLGDFSFYGKEKSTEILSALQGHIRLVMGNHDTRSTQWYRNCGFEEVYDCPILFESFWLLSHEPLYLNSNMPYGNLFGHVHGNPAYADASSQSCCVCVERTDYRPISFEEVKRRMGLIL